ncbi:MAG: hypothetical protein SVR94_15070 [Pseudomonadota bacterium]|nr:hypothetical protein [Pseudomonadota bacterium]
MSKFNKILVLVLTLIPSVSFSDWAVVPDLTSSTLWKLVSENRAEVVSSVGFGGPTGPHRKQTVFIIKKAKKSEGDIKWAIEKDGKYRPVMCTESWNDKFTYLGSSCSIPGCVPDNKKCLDEVTKNL